MMNTLAMIELLAADEAAKGGGSMWPNLLLMGLLFFVMWIVMIRPQQKRQKALNEKLEALKKGDKVITAGGLHGVVNHISEKTVSLKVGDGQFLTFQKSSIQTVLKKGEKEEDEAKK